LFGTRPDPLVPINVDTITKRGRSPGEILSDVSATKF
jgi:hypothetical protein